MKNHFGSLEKLRGKKIAMTWACSPSYGKPLSVPRGIIGLMSRFGMQVSLACPEGYGLIPEVVELAKQNSRKGGGSFEVVSSMEKAPASQNSWGSAGLQATRMPWFSAQKRAESPTGQR
jgi:ornithine carbamoyltransferase